MSFDEGSFNQDGFNRGPEEQGGSTPGKALLLIVEGDTEIWTDCPPPHLGGGVGVIRNDMMEMPNLNDFVYIGKQQVILKGQYYTGPDGCFGSAGQDSPCSSLLEINGTPVLREDDRGLDGCHALLGAIPITQDFVTVED